MLNNTVSYRALLRIIGAMLLLYGLYCTFVILTAHTEVSGSIQYSGPLIAFAPGEVITAIFYGSFFQAGPLLYVGSGLFLIALTTMRVRLAYWGLQIAFWLVSMSNWFRLANFFGSGFVSVPESFLPFFIATLICSLILLAAYIPITRLLNRLLAPRNEEVMVSARLTE